MVDESRWFKRSPISRPRHSVLAGERVQPAEANEGSVPPVEEDQGQPPYEEVRQPELIHEVRLFYTTARALYGND